MASIKAIIGGCLAGALSVTLLPVLAVATGLTDPADASCAGGGTGQTIASIPLTAEQVGNAATIVATTARYPGPGGRALPPYAAVVSIATAYQESRLINSSVQTDHDSEGLFQERISIYTAAVATGPVKATNAFLTRLLQVPDWQQQPVTVDAQTVQQSAHPAAYAAWQPLAEQLTAQLWPAAAADTPSPTAIPPATAAPTTPSATGPTTATTPAALCTGTGGAGGGGNVAGSPTIPPGLQLTGSTAGNAAVRFALQQLGKPYVFGAAGPDSYDCSGLTMASWATAGIALPHYTVTQLGIGTPESVNLTTAVSGDLVFIPGSDGTPTAPGHVGMIAGRTPNGHLWLIQAPETGIPVETTDTTHWAGQIVAVRHIA